MKAIIFDVDGTLIESMAVDTELYFAAVNQVLGPVRIREKLGDYDNVSDSGILAQILDDNGIPSDTPAADATKAVFVESVARHIESVGPFPAIDGALQFFEKARNADDVRVAVATGGWRKSALLKLESAGFDIDGLPLATSDDSPSRIGIMQHALAGIGKEITTVTYYGDAAWDEQACDSLGWTFVAVGPGLGGIESYAGMEP
jgi:phosphoglycolate phosphatase-like HAD superfamily hydrolase